MSDEQIKQYIKDKGEARKNEMFDSMVFQTKDYLRSKAAVESAGGMDEALAQQRSNWEEEQAQIANDQRATDEEIAQVSQELVQIRERLARELSEKEGSSGFVNKM